MKIQVAELVDLDIVKDITDQTIRGAVNVLSQIHKSHPCKNQSRIVSASHP